MSEFPAGGSFRYPPPSETRFPATTEERFTIPTEPRFANGAESRFFSGDARRPLPPPKRTRREFPEPEELGPRPGFLSRGPERGEPGFPPRIERGFDERSRATWRDQEPLPPGDMVPYGSSLGPGIGSGMGMPSGSASLGNLNLVGMPDDSMLSPHVPRGIPPLDMNRGVSMNGLGVSGDLLPPDASSTLYVDGFPLYCSRREAAHIFRPFIGFKEVRLVHKDTKRTNGEKIVLCFAEFTDPRCAAAALESLQGYKLDESDHNSPCLRLMFARNPAPRGVHRGDFRDHPREREDFRASPRGGPPPRR